MIKIASKLELNDSYIIIDMRQVVEVHGVFSLMLTNAYDLISYIPIAPWEGDIDWVIGKRMMELDLMPYMPDLFEIVDFKAQLINPDVEY